MSAAAVAPPMPHGESKTARKKKSKGDTGTPTSELADKPVGGSGDGATGLDGGSELPFLREIHKNVRNVKKKIAATQKVDSIIAEHPDLSLDDLLATKKINADQKQQAERKPALQAQLRELEEELDRYKKVEELALRQHDSESESLKLEHAKELEALRDSVAEEAARAEAQKLRGKLLHLSKFLRAAAAKRQDGDETAEESRAFEGALLLVYGGDVMAVQAMENIIGGNDELVPTVEGTKTTVSYKQLRASFEGEDATIAEDEGSTEAFAAAGHAHAAGALEQAHSDPTAVHAGLTEMNTPLATHATVNGGTAPTTSAPGAVDSGAANAAAEAGWHNMSSSVTSGPDDWVQVHQIPRDPSETETGAQGTAANSTNLQSWAEDVPTESNTIPVHPAPPPPLANDGFHEVHHGRTRGRGGFHGEHRGRGRGGYRGDRGDGSFRGRGGFRGERGGGEGGPRGRGRPYRGARGPRGESSA